MAKGNNRPTVKIELEIYKDEWMAAAAYNLFIDKHLKKGTKIPARVLKKYFSFFNSSEQLKESLREARADEITQIAFEKFNNKHFVFSGFKKVPMFQIVKTAPRKTQKLPYSLENLLRDVTLKSLAIIDDNAIKEKDNVIGVIYMQIVRYKSERLNDKHQQFLKTYKMGAIAAFITNQLGYSVISKKNATAAELYQAARNAISKIKKP